MTRRTKKTAAALTGAVALASGAYALGSQAGGGAALAGGTTPSATQPGYGFGPGPGPGFRDRGPGRPLSDLATRLGVSEAKLRAALQDLRPQKREDHLAGLAGALSKQLGVS